MPPMNNYILFLRKTDIFYFCRKVLIPEHFIWSSNWQSAKYFANAGLAEEYRDQFLNNRQPSVDIIRLSSPNEF